METLFCIKRNGCESGAIRIGHQDYFYKYLPRKLFKRESGGYDFVKRYYPVPKLLFKKQDRIGGAMLFEYEQTVQENKGLLLDVFTNSRIGKKSFNAILDLYKDVFLKTLRRDRGEACEIFFDDRINTRLKRYSRKFITSFSTVKLNGYELTPHLDAIIKDTAHFFRKKKKLWCVASQGDPNDLNIGLKPAIFDYASASLDDLVAG